MGLQKIVSLVLLLLLTSCGSKKKTITKTQIDTKTIKNIVKTDSSVSYLNISELKIVQRDTTKPITIKDSNGNITTFYNVKEIITKEDKSVLKTLKKDSIIETITEGKTIKEQTKVKEPIKFNYWFIIIPLLIYLILRKFIKSFFIWQ